jgi:hypothetical protein
MSLVYLSMIISFQWKIFKFECIKEISPFFDLRCDVGRKSYWCNHHSEHILEQHRVRIELSQSCDTCSWISVCPENFDYSSAICRSDYYHRSSSIEMQPRVSVSSNAANVWNIDSCGARSSKANYSYSSNSPVSFSFVILIALPSRATTKAWNA